MMSFSNEMNIKNGCLLSARQIESPNFDSRPESIEIDLLVIHSISLPPNCFEGEGILQFFTNQLDVDEHPYYRKIGNLKVSSHILIRRTGEIIQFVNFDSRAWHAGESSFQGRKNCNDYSIGIELEGNDTSTFEKKQYDVLLPLLKSIMKNYPNITNERIVGHDMIAPGRKTDPGKGFDWSIIRDISLS